MMDPKYLNVQDVIIALNRQMVIEKIFLAGYTLFTLFKVAVMIVYFRVRWINPPMTFYKVK